MTFELTNSTEEQRDQLESRGYELYKLDMNTWNVETEDQNVDSLTNLLELWENLEVPELVPQNKRFSYRMV